MGLMKTDSYEMFRVPSGTKMTPELLAKYITKHKALVKGRYELLQNAYENRYEIYDQERKPDWKPDNRISVNFAKYIVDTFNGFFCGNPIKAESDEDDVSEYLQYLDQYCDQDNTNSELAKISSIHGAAYEMYYLDETGEADITYLSPLEAFFIYDDSILERPMFFVRYYRDSENVEWGSWSDNTVVQHFVNRGTYKWVDEPKLHGFGDVPATEFIENDERLGIFESALPMINAYNKAISEKANDVDYFADAYMKVLGPKIQEEDLRQIRRNRIINFEGDMSLPEVDFLQKPNADATQENLITRLERMIFQISMVPNIADENFGEASGISLRYKMQSMNNLFRTKERKFTSAMQRRYRVIFSNPAIRNHGVTEDDWIRIRFHFTPNYPANIADEASVAARLSGVVSQETQLKVLSIVDSPREEMERIQKEEADRMQSDEEWQNQYMGRSNTLQE